MSREDEQPRRSLGDDQSADSISRQVTPYAADIPHSSEQDARVKIDGDRPESLTETVEQKTPDSPAQSSIEGNSVADNLPTIPSIQVHDGEDEGSTTDGTAARQDQALQVRPGPPSRSSSRDKDLPPTPGETKPSRGDMSMDDQSGRERSDSRSTTVSRGPVSSSVFVVTALESIAASKEARRSKELADAVQAALQNIKSQDQPVNPEVIFRPLQLATRTLSIPLQVTALDCIGKLISYSYFAFPSAATSHNGNEADTPPLIERAIETICDCALENEATPVEIQQQIVKSLLAAILDDKIVVHGAGLLKAVRQIYNIFIFSKSSQNQQVAQGSLTQMVATVFERVRTRLDLKEIRIREQSEARSDEGPSGDTSILEETEFNGTDSPLNESSEQVDSPHISKENGTEQLTLQSFENSKNLDDALVADSAPTTVTRARKAKATRSGSGPGSRNSTHEEREDGETSSEDEEDEIYIKDAFLVFRSLCKLSQKSLGPDQQQDLRSQSMRTKLLSLHLIHHLLNNHIDVFTSPLSIITSGSSGEKSGFMQVAKPHLCLSLSRNASSSVPRVYEVCCEIFWLSLKHMRVIMKKELEVFLKEVYLAVLDKRSAPGFQKQMFMDVLERLSADPRALVEIYLNYDCDRTALDNIYQSIIEHLSRICSTPVIVTTSQQQQYHENHGKAATPVSEWHSRGALLPGLSTASIAHAPTPVQVFPIEYIMKQQSLRCLVEILRSLDNWSSQLPSEESNGVRHSDSRASYEDSRESLDRPGPVPPSPRILSGGFDTGSSTPIAEDDPSEIERVKKRKTALNEAIRQFNFKPKRGIKALLSEGLIRSDSPEDIARFLISNDRLDKAALGEYLGDGDEANIAIMHAFVDCMEFRQRRFVDALRQFLQSFRLPGEAQKIDRFMLKFAERYLTGNPNAFANADTAYVLAYSVIMLNTDQHSAKLRGKRMNAEDFIKNNRGINNDQDLPPEYLTGIYEEIASNEIVLASERERAADLGIAISAPAPGLASRASHVLANVGRDLQKEKYAQASEEMANKTESLYRSLIRAQKKSVVRDALSRFIPATSIKHVGRSQARNPDCLPL
jgi:brefeldin A-inhibited guanine nucleotide-exchange protein